MGNPCYPFVPERLVPLYDCRGCKLDDKKYGNLKKSCLSLLKLLISQNSRLENTKN